MKFDIRFVSVISFISCLKYATAIMCYDCNSAFDPRCGVKFDPFSLGVINCSLQDPPEHIESAEPTICRSIKMDIYGEIRVLRKCGYITDEPGEPACQRRTGNGDLFVTYCSCDTDLCNSATLQQMAFGVMAVAAVMFKFIV